MSDVIEGDPFVVVITGLTRHTLVQETRGPRRGQYRKEVDASPLRISHLSLKHAREEAPGLAVHLKDAPSAQVALPNGSTVPLAEWVNPAWKPAAAKPSAPEAQPEPEQQDEPAGPDESAAGE